VAMSRRDSRLGADRETKPSLADIIDGVAFGA